jgi:hypothetical protein
MPVTLKKKLTPFFPGQGASAFLFKNILAFPFEK